MANRVQARKPKPLVIENDQLTPCAQVVILTLHLGVAGKPLFQKQFLLAVIHSELPPGLPYDSECATGHVRTEGKSGGLVWPVHLGGGDRLAIEVYFHHIPGVCHHRDEGGGERGALRHEDLRMNG